MPSRRARIGDPCYNCRTLGLVPEGKWLGGGRCSNSEDPRNSSEAVAAWLHKEELKRAGRQESALERRRRQEARWRGFHVPPRQHRPADVPPPWRRVSREDYEHAPEDPEEEELEEEEEVDAEEAVEDDSTWQAAMLWDQKKATQTQASSSAEASDELHERLRLAEEQGLGSQLDLTEEKVKIEGAPQEDPTVVRAWIELQGAHPDAVPYRQNRAAAKQLKSVEIQSEKKRVKIKKELVDQTERVIAEASQAAVEERTRELRLRQATALAMVDAALNRQYRARQSLRSEVDPEEALSIIKRRKLVCLTWLWIIIKRWIYRAKAVVQVTRYITLECRVPKRIADAVENCTLD